MSEEIFDFEIEVEEETVDDGYRAHPAIANSDLKYLHSPKLFQLNKARQLQPEESKSLSLGTLFDDYLLDRDNFSNKYIERIDNIETPSHPNQDKFVNYCMMHRRSNISDEDIIEYYSRCYSKADDKKALELYTKLKPYMQFLKAAQGKSIYSSDDKIKIVSMEANCYMNSEIAKYFQKRSTLVNEEIFKHLQITGIELYGIKWKGELDLVYINYDTKEIHLVDLKTTSKKLAYFGWQIKSYKYYRQLALYRRLLISYLSFEDIISGINDWDVKVFILACETTPLHEAGLIPIPESVLELGTKELIDAAEDIRFYDSINWKERKSVVQNNGLEVLDFTEIFDELK